MTTFLSTENNVYVLKRSDKAGQKSGTPKSGKGAKPWNEAMQHGCAARPRLAPLNAGGEP
jgi:hypothetical protein